MISQLIEPLSKRTINSRYSRYRFEDF